MLGGRRFKARQPSELVFLWTSELVYIHKQIATKKSNQVNGFLKEIFRTKQIITTHRLMWHSKILFGFYQKLCVFVEGHF